MNVWGLQEQLAREILPALCPRPLQSGMFTGRKAGSGIASPTSSRGIFVTSQMGSEFELSQTASMRSANHNQHQPGGAT
jgi:hypothetical protein